MILPCSVQTNIQGEELREHGTHLFPVACYLDLLPRDEIAWHWHNELELGVIASGSAVVETGSDSRPLHAGEGFFINSNILHTAVLSEDDHCEIHSVVFHPRAVSGSTDTIIWQKYLKPLMENQAFSGLYLTPDVVWQKRILACLGSLWLAAEREPFGYEIRVCSELATIVALLSENQPIVSKKSFGRVQRNNARIKEMLRFIQANYGRELTIEDIASACAISESECIRCFRATINTTPIAYLRSYRLQQAAMKLQLTTDKISTIAVSCGFQEMSYFARSFKEVYGCTPSEYRSGK